MMEGGTERDLLSLEGHTEPSEAENEEETIKEVIEKDKVEETKEEKDKLEETKEEKEESSSKGTV